jgi:hypothetical protein
MADAMEKWPNSEESNETVRLTFSVKDISTQRLSFDPFLGI